MDRFKMSVGALMTIGPICSRCLYEMPSGLKEQLGFVCSNAYFVILGAREGGGSFLGRGLRCVLFSCRRWRVVVCRWKRSVY